MLWRPGQSVDFHLFRTDRSLSLSSGLRELLSAVTVTPRTSLFILTSTALWPPCVPEARPGGLPHISKKRRAQTLRSNAKVLGPAVGSA